MQVGEIGHLQKWPRVSLDQVPRSWCTETSPDRQSHPGLVHRDGHSHPEEALAMLQLPGTGTRTGYGVSAVDRGHQCYRCGESGHRARGCPASAPKCPLCESLGAPVNHRMGGVACAPPPPKTKRKRPVHEPAATAKTQGNTAEAAVDGREEGHGIDPMNSRGSSRVTWEGRDGSKSCSSGLSGRARSPSRWWLRRIASLT